MIRLLTPPDSNPAAADARRRERLFSWIAKLLENLGLAARVRRAKSIAALRGVTIDVESAEIQLAVYDAMHPATGEREDYFRNLRGETLKRVIRKRFLDLKKDREETLRKEAGGVQSPWETGLILKDDKIGANLHNLILILRNAPKWDGVLAFDEFSARVIIRKRPPWEAKEIGAPWTDHHDTLTQVWFQAQGINPSTAVVGRAVQAAAKSNSFHPLREYLDPLIWDGKPRLDTWLIDYFHVEGGDYVRAISSRFMISAVARAYQPGCQVDHVLCLEGPQGLQKSTALRTLAVRDTWFTDRLSHIASKDAVIELEGVWIVEVAEMDALTRVSASAAKAFVSRRDENYRPPYGKHTIRRGRQNVFVTTLNPPAGGYLKDITGARRFWPVRCRGMIDLVGLKQAVAQLWAEAVSRYKAGCAWHLETPELEALATAEQEARFIVDMWEDRVREWLAPGQNDVSRIDVAIEEVLEHALGVPREGWTQTAFNRVSAILTRLRYVRYRSRIATATSPRSFRYRRELAFEKKVQRETLTTLTAVTKPGAAS